jgi:hypothetical protein
MAALIAATAVQPLVLSVISEIHRAHLVAGYLGLGLVAVFYAALGLWISLLVDNPVAAYVLTFGAIAVLHLVGWAGIDNGFQPIADFLGLGPRVSPFFAGEVRAGGVAYLLCGAGVALALAWQALRGKRREG